MGIAYSADYPECYRDTVKWSFDQFNNLNFFLTRTKPYNPKGRNQTESESDAKGHEIEDLLIDYKVPYYVTTGDSAGLEFIVDKIIKVL